MLLGGAGDDRIQGRNGGDRLEGGMGRDRLSGGDGDDTLDGGGNADTLEGGAGSDTVTYADTTAPVVVDLAEGETRFPTRDWPSEILRSIENAVTGLGDDTLLGTDGANRLSSGAGDDSLSGGAGDDLLIGGKGDDIISAGAGADTIQGASGADTIRGGSGFDVLDLSGISRDVRVHLAKGEAGARDGAWSLEFTSIESAILGQGDDRITGRDTADALDGGLGDDTILGGAGDDTLSGGTLGGRWDLDDDGAYAGDGSDWIRGGKGSDTLELVDLWITAGSPGTMTVNLRDGTAEIDGLDEIDHLSSIENIVAGGTSDLLIGDDKANRIDGGDGLNDIRGGGGDDTLIGGDWYYKRDDEVDVREDIYGGDGDDVIIANGFSLYEWQYHNLGDQYLSGGAGDDYIDPGLANSQIRGGRGADIFHFTTESEEIEFVGTVATTAVIQDFGRGDLIEIELTGRGEGETPEFIGEVGTVDQEYMKLFYVVEGEGGEASTRLRMYFAIDWDDEPVGLDILLEDYADPITEADIAFV